MDPVVILGCGFTGRRVARLLAESGRQVRVTARDIGSLADFDAHSFDASRPEDLRRLGELVPAGAAVLHSIPDHGAQVVEALGDLPRRVVYLSTTGVYGAVREVDELTAIAPNTQRSRERAAVEAAVEGGPWESLILRPAAIYGPGRGVQVALPAGKYRLAGDGSNFVSRVHVDDLAAITAAALQSDATGAYPVSDDHPCTSAEIAEWVGRLLDVPVAYGEAVESLSETRRSDRRVDGRAIRRVLGVDLRYPSYRQGIPASLEASC